MACGTPVLATPVGAVDDVIISGKTGFLLEIIHKQQLLEVFLKR